MLHMVIGRTHDGVTVYGIYETLELASIRKESLGYDDYESYEIIPLNVNEDIQI